MKDIAAAAGVAQSTVSRVLNNNTQGPVVIAAATRQRVLDAAASLGYRPNPLARALRGAGTMLLGAVVRDITDPFFGHAIEALSTESVKRGYNVVLGHARKQPHEVLLLTAVLEARHCDAIILLGDMTAHTALMEDLQNAHVPVVALWQSARVPGIPTVNVDDALGMDLAVGHLHELGHTRIGFVGGRPLVEKEARRAGFLAAMARRGLTVREDHVRAADNTLENGRLALEALLDREPPTAIVAATDILALGILNGAWAHGIQVPSELSVVGFDDIAVSSFAVPPLTTLAQPTREMVDAALSLAIDESPADESRDAALVLPPRLVVRGSTGPAPSA